MKPSDFSYPSILEAISPFSATGRSESAAFLIWYLVNMYRLDDIEAIDAVCDQKGDKGVDGIYVNEGNGTIDIFQCRVFQSTKTVGDTSLKSFREHLRSLRQSNQYKAFSIPPAILP